MIETFLMAMLTAHTTTISTATAGTAYPVTPPGAANAVDVIAVLDLERAAIGSRE